MGKVIGIDLGTTNSVVAVLQGSLPEIIANVNGGRTTPSAVGKTKTGDWLVGEAAKRQLATAPGCTVLSIKRFIGMREDELPADLTTYGHGIASDEAGNACIEIEGELYSPVEMSAMILRTLRERAEEVLGEEVTQAVITVPAYFNDSQRQATKDAGRVAGLEVLRILNEPTAAALAYGLDEDRDQNIAVFDLGGGTFDISILHLGDGVYEVKSTGGDTHLGGDDFDSAIVDWAVGEFEKAEGVDLRADKAALGRLKEAAEKAKCELSQSLEARMQLPFVASVDGAPVHMDLTLSRARFERMIGPLVDRCLDSCLAAMDDAEVRPLDIHEVILVGGSTRIPMVQRAVEELFAKLPNKSVHPDEVVALGAAIQAGVLDGDVEDVLLLDVTPLSLGIETLGGVVTKLIERNTTVPTRKTELFSTVSDNQRSVNIHVVQGEREMAADNRTLGRFELGPLPLAPRGVPQIEVTFDIDANGILDITAVDKGTGKTQSIKIEGTSNLSEEEIERMIEEAEQRAGEDKEKRRFAELRHRGETLLLSAEESMKENASSLAEEDRDQMAQACRDLMQQLQGDDNDGIGRAIKDLEELSHRIARTIYT